MHAIVVSTSETKTLVTLCMGGKSNEGKEEEDGGRHMGANAHLETNHYSMDRTFFSELLINSKIAMLMQLIASYIHIISVANDLVLPFHKFSREGGVKLRS